MINLDANIAAVQDAIQRRLAIKHSNALEPDYEFDSMLKQEPSQDSQDQSTPVAAMSGPSMPLKQPSGNVGQWIHQALGAMHLDNSYAKGIANMIQHESGGNPNSINNYDSNARAGHASQGIMQTIPSTFKAHMLPGHGNILNPVDNIIAAVRYAQGRYGDQMVKNGGRTNSQGKYIGY